MPSQEYNLGEMFQVAPLQEREPKALEPIRQDDPAAPAAEMVTVPVTKESHQEEQARKKASFIKALLDARTPKEITRNPEPVAPRVLEQTRLEMEAGANAVAKASAAKQVVHKQDPGVTPVFRPKDYVPDMNHGKLEGRVLSEK